MLGTYGSFLLLIGASSLAGQAILAACGRRSWSWLAPAVGVAALIVVAWWTVRLPGEGTAALTAIAIGSAISAVVLRRRGVSASRERLRIGLAVAVLALAAASLPFVVEGRFGILGTGLNPDMSQHLLAADRLADGGSERLISEGYPLGPHAVVVALGGLGIDPVEAFGGITIAIAVASALAALAALGSLAPRRRVVAALLVGFAYMVASYLVQGAFKETMQVLFLLAFAVGLAELARPGGRGEGEAMPAPETTRAALPLAALAAGSAYAYSFPGLLWLAGAAGLWALVELGLAVRRSNPAVALGRARRAGPTVAVALGATALAILPEAGRMASFAGFETFDPRSAGLGNLFNPISPLEALGVWPSGDFRLDPGAGSAPALAFWAGGLLGLVAVAYGTAWSLKREQRAVPCALAVAIVLYLFALNAGTPYQEAKAIALIAPLAMLIALRALLDDEPLAAVEGSPALIAQRRGRAPALIARFARPAKRGLAAAFVAAAGGCSLLALVNGPVGPSAYSPELIELQSRLERGSTLVLASPELLAAHGRDYLVWELRGGRVCVESTQTAGGASPNEIAHVITTDGAEEPPFGGLRLERRAGPYALWATPGASGAGPCPLIADGVRADPGAPGAPD